MAGNSQGPSTKYALIQKASTRMLVAVAVASFIVSFSVVIIGFLWDLRGFNSAVIEQQDETVDTLKANLEAYPQLKEGYDLFVTGENLIEQQGDKDNVDTVFDALPSKYDFPAVATAIEQLADRAGVDLTGFDGDDLEGTAIDSAPEPVPTPIPFAITIEGSYSEMQAFLRGLDNTIRPFSVNRVQISGSDDELKVDLDIDTYYQPALDVSEVVRRSVTE